MDDDDVLDDAMHPIKFRSLCVCVCVCVVIFCVIYCMITLYLISDKLIVD